MRVKLTLESFNLQEAKRMRELRNIPTPPDFEGPDFREVESTGFVTANSEWFTVQLRDGTRYTYPASSIARIAEYPDEV